MKMKMRLNEMIELMDHEITNWDNEMWHYLGSACRPESEIKNNCYNVDVKKEFKKQVKKFNDKHSKDTEAFEDWLIFGEIDTTALLEMFYEVYCNPSKFYVVLPNPKDLKSFIKIVVGDFNKGYFAE